MEQRERERGRERKEDWKHAPKQKEMLSSFYVLLLFHSMRGVAAYVEEFVGAAFFGPVRVAVLQQRALVRARDDDQAAVGA